MGTPKEAFELHAQTITAIGTDRLRPRFDSMEDLFEQTSQLITYVREDRAAFEAIPRFDISIIDTLEDRLNALIYLFGYYTEVALNKSEAREQWDALEPQAHQLKRDIIESLRFIYEELGDDKRLKELTEIAIGTGRKDLFCDFAQLSGVAVRDKAHLISMGLPETIVEDTDAIRDQLLPLFGSLEATPEEVEKRALMVQQSFTWLDEAVSEIRRYGKFAFRNDAEKQERYKNQNDVLAGKASAKARQEAKEASAE